MSYKKKQRSLIDQEKVIFSNFCDYVMCLYSVLFHYNQGEIALDIDFLLECLYSAGSTMDCYLTKPGCQLIGLFCYFSVHHLGQR